MNRVADRKAKREIRKAADRLEEAAKLEIDVLPRVTDEKQRATILARIAALKASCDTVAYLDVMDEVLRRCKRVVVG